MLAAEILDLINMDKEPLILQIVNMQTNQKLDMPTGIFIVALLITMVLSIVYFIIGIVGLQVINAKDVNSLDCMIATLKFSCGAVVVMLLCQYTLVSIYFINLS
jgi:hypothetical protein